MKRIVVCADDYALAPGVSKAIRALIEQGRINATSVMTVVPGFATEAAVLAMTVSPFRFETGLHVTLTGPFRPLAMTPLVSEDGNFTPLAKLLNPLARFRIDRRTVETEIGAQMRAFTDAFGRPPDFVDGHQHVQLLPGVCEGFLTAVARFAPKAWVRQCGLANWRALVAADNKARFLAALSFGFRRNAARAGLRFNPAFAGAYDFGADENFAALFARFLGGLPAGGLVMCHPGFVDAELKARDPLTDRREAEYAFFAGNEFPQILARASAMLS
jgi:predicted glycoside hydrolase/deacetylase ChbG (UPF0249 family)